jgi:polygalacturonase
MRRIAGPTFVSAVVLLFLTPGVEPESAQHDHHQRHLLPFFVTRIAGECAPKSEAACSKKETENSFYNVRTFGAIGDGKTLDTVAINQTIAAASAAGGGTVSFPAGTYLSVSIHLRSNITLHLDQGATIRAADTVPDKVTYDLPEPNAWDTYQDFGHSHWQNSLIWGVGLENVQIIGPGLIDGKGLTRRSPRARRVNQPGDRPVTLGGQPGARQQSPLGEDDDPKVMNGLGNKAISLKLCRNVLLRDISILNGGHFALLATGVDNLTIDNLKIDTNRDGLDIDSCRNVRVTNCSINSPNDDAIVLKSSYALGFARATENVTITNCLVAGFDIGSLLDGTFKRNVVEAPDHDGPAGRLKLGTESNGGFRNIAIANVVFDHCRGLALETVDGGWLEDVTITNLTMRDVMNSPIFLRLGRRLRGPVGGTPGQLRRVSISNIVAYNADSRYASIIAGVPEHDIEDTRLSDIHIWYRGGGRKELADLQPPERETNYPEPSMFGELPAYGFFIRHAKGIELHNVEVSYAEDESRPPFLLQDVNGVTFDHVSAQRLSSVAAFVLRNVTDFTVHDCKGVANTHIDRADQKSFF